MGLAVADEFVRSSRGPAFKCVGMVACGLALKCVDVVAFAVARWYGCMFVHASDMRYVVRLCGLLVTASAEHALL